MDDEAIKVELFKELKTRREFDQRWGDRCYSATQVLSAVAILGSFGTAIAGALGWVSTSFLSILAGVPGTVIIVERMFSFGARARWSWMMVAKTQELERALAFENCSAAEVSRRFSALRIEMDSKFPADRLGDTEGMG